ncbi:MULTISPECIES: acylneuraminate cytidylyltransferase family protein [Leptospira]|uniref:Acylneuraminate cytidylyltransferase family protein n=1 Tax=Leptospira interrogans serovar Bataviae TaxID=312175 RepID=A0AAQ0B2E1_LEPIR|nr:MULTISPECIES: acylneuraminate cytidylyltransferase family protein [Leptospira]EMN69582.1 cytidylyltransferase domain protein [Leptospira interrogans serovar Bataviae str. UI 08561]EKP04912.1 cytidylyltransferase domain protein [Leptospira kirschneri str. 2008720114]EKR25159.1 cytidylyltransferase domain protein [Leptospira interrogans serovar Bataviae str. L1111]MCR8648657.1 cytidylyltransferase [Leptospira interrogans serovar Bataviae]OAM73303.1 cytidylyltransferase [Leptospira interrogans
MISKKKPRILAITLARGGSKSVPRKNIRHICGIPLIGYTIIEAKLSKWIDRYIVSTDDSEIQSVAIQYGAEAPFLRPAELSTDTTSSAVALQHAVNWVENQEGNKYDFIVELMCTNPLKTVSDIDACIEKLVNTGADSVIAVHKLDDHHPIRIKKIVNDKIVDFCLPEIPEMRRQDLKPDAYIRSGSIYALTRQYLMNEGKRFGSENSRPYILAPEKAVNVDTEMDFLVAEKILQSIPRSYVKPMGS